MLDLSRLDHVRREAWRRLVGGPRPAEVRPPTVPQVPQASVSARVVCVASGKGGTGKSILSTNLAVSRAARGERVLLLDFDAGLANDHLLLGLAPQYDLGHVLEGVVSPQEAFVQGPRGMHLLSGGVGRHALVNPTRKELERLFRALRQVEDEFDLIVIDHGAGMNYATVAHLAATSTMILVTSHEVTGLSDAYALYKRALMVNPHIRVGLVINRTPDAASAEAAWVRFRSAAHKFLGSQPEWIGTVPADLSVSRSVELRQPVSISDPDSEAARAFDKISRWAPLDLARTSSAFYERARRALR